LRFYFIVVVRFIEPLSHFADIALDDDHPYDPEPSSPSSSSVPSATLVRQLSPRENTARGEGVQYSAPTTTRPGSSKPAWLNKDRNKRPEGQ
jgi:hypothetical protein